MIAKIVMAAAALSLASVLPLEDVYLREIGHLAAGCGGTIDFYQPAKGVVSDEAIAKEVAFQYLHAVFPRDKLKPLFASFKQGVWHVWGYFPTGNVGGSAHIFLCKTNGRVLRLFHEQ